MRYLEGCNADAAETLSREAVLAGAAIIVIGARSRFSLGGMLLGSTAIRLTDDPQVPVAVLPRRMLDPST